jgi:hypothetical protein
LYFADLKIILKKNPPGKLVGSPGFVKCPDMDARVLIAVVYLFTTVLPRGYPGMIGKSLGSQFIPNFMGQSLPAPWTSAVATAHNASSLNFVMLTL